MADELILLRGTRHVVTDCINCGIVFTVPQTVWNQQRDKGGYHHCPNGHGQGWSKERSESERIRLERDRLKQQLAEKDDEIARERRWRDEESERRSAAERRAAAARGQVTKLKKGASAGKCPCCRRTFQNMYDHMRKQHPGFVCEPIAGDEIPEPKAQH